MELHQIRYFLALSKTLNFTRASEICNVTQPALTRAIQRLEEELGGPLIYRERNLTQLTELGRVMLPHLEQTCAAAEAAKRLADSLKRREHLTLTIGLAPAIPGSLLCPILAEIAARFPSLEVRIDSEEQRTLNEALLEGEVEAALLVDDGQLPERLHRWKLYEEGCQIVFAPGHRLESLDVVPLAALDGETILQGRRCGGFADLALPLCRDAGATIRLRHSGACVDHMQDLAAARLGVTLLPRGVAVSPPLLARPIEDDALIRSVVLAAVSGRQHSPAVDGFIRLARARSFAPPS